MTRQTNYDNFVATRYALTSALIEASKQTPAAQQSPSLAQLASFLREGMHAAHDAGTASSKRERLDAIKADIVAAQAFFNRVVDELDAQVEAL